MSTQLEDPLSSSSPPRGMQFNVHHPPSKALYCTCNVHVVSQRLFAKALSTYPTQRKLQEMRCPATLARKLRSLANEHPAIKPPSGTKASTTPCNLHSCHTKESVPLCSLVAFWNIHLQAANRPPTTTLGQVWHRWALQTGQHCGATDDESSYPWRLDRHVLTYFQI